MSSVNNVIRMDEVRKHEGDNENVWLVIHDKVYDVSAFLEDVSIQMKYRDELKLGVGPRLREISNYPCLAVA